MPHRHVQDFESNQQGTAALFGDVSEQAPRHGDAQDIQAFPRYSSLCLQIRLRLCMASAPGYGRSHSLAARCPATVLVIGTACGDGQ